LVGLQCLHIFWFYLISRMIYRMLVVGEIEKDVRSDEEDDKEFHDDSTDDYEGDKKDN
jgi:hypothetical protein